MRQRLRNGTVTLTNIKTVTDKRGVQRRYLQVKGQPLQPLPPGPIDDPAFIAAWAAAMKAARGTAVPVTPGSIASLCAAFRRSPDFRSKSTSYQQTLRRHMNAIEDKASTSLARDLRRRHITADMATLTPAVASARLKTWRALCRHGLAIGMITDDPTIGLKKPAQPKTDGHVAWSRDAIAQFRTRWPIGTVQRAIFELLLWTGARISDAVRIGPGMVNRDGVLAYRQQKTGGMAYVPWSCTLPPYVTTADRDMMLAAIAPLAGHMTYLATRAGRPRSAKSIGGDLAKAARKAGLQLTAHGLRKARATQNAEGGATAHQIAAWTGHESLSEVAHYTRAVDRMQAVMGTERDANVGNTSVPIGKSGRK